MFALEVIRAINAKGAPKLKPISMKLSPEPHFWSCRYPAEPCRECEGGDFTEVVLDMPEQS